MSARFLLRVVEGANVGTFALLGDGEPLVVGRDPRHGLALDDPRVSRAHLELLVTGGQVQLRDLGSANGTRVNDQPVAEALLRAEDEIHIGDSRLRLQTLVGATAAPRPPESPRDAPVASPREPRPPLPAAPPETAVLPAPPRAPEPEPVEWVPELPRSEEPAPAERAAPTVVEAAPPLRICTSITPLRPRPRAAPPPRGSLGAALLRLEPGPGDPALYAVIDAARDTSLPFRLALNGFEVFTLFDGPSAEALAHVGPCLVPIDEVAPLLEPWLEGLGGSRGVLVQSPARLADLAAHLREIFNVTGEDGEEYFFRFYDPRVLRGFVATCTPEELAELFGPIARWLVEDEKGEDVVALALEGGKLAVRPLEGRA